MSYKNEGRIRNLEGLILNIQCKTCWGTGSALVHVPPGEDKSAAEFNPTHCEECARPLHFVRQVVGVSRETAARLHATPESKVRSANAGYLVHGYEM